jgi:MFS family permease
MIEQAAAEKPSTGPVIAALMAALFAVTVGYGVILPVLPFSIRELVEPGDSAAISRHTGLLSGTYTLALFFFAPLWGRVSDRLGRRPLILCGLTGFALTLALFGLVSRLPLLYLTRFFNGAFAAAVTPAAYALIGDLAPSRAIRAHQFALLNVAAAAGFIVGPLLGGLVVAVADTYAPWLAQIGVPAPFLVTAALALLSVPIVGRLLPNAARRNRARAAMAPLGDHRAVRVRLLAIALATAAAVGAFEVGLSLHGQMLGLDSYRIGMMFMECSVVMFIVQGVVFSPFVKVEATRWFVVPSLAALAVGLVMVPFVEGYPPLILAVALVAASAGILSPIVTYWISLGADDRQGAELGLQTAAASLGQALGSAVGGLFFNVAIVPGASFIIPAVIVLAVLAPAYGLPQLLACLPQAETPPSTRRALDADAAKSAP